MLKYKETLDYFKTMAAAHVDIGECYTHPDRLFAKNRVGFSALILPIKARMVDSGDNQLVRPYLEILVLRPCKSGDFDDIETAYEECQEICIDIATRVRRDANVRPATENQYPKHIDLNTVELTPEGPYTNNSYGFSIAFALLDNAAVAYNSAKWQ